MSCDDPMESSKRWRRACVVILLAMGQVLMGCGDDAPHHELGCDDGVDNDGDGRIDCEDTDCWGTPECPQGQCGDGAIGGDEQCDGADLGGQSCLGLGYDGGTLGCTDGCTLETSGCTGDPVCGNGVIDTGEQCDGAMLDGATCESLGYTSGTVTCDASCMFDVFQCERKLLAECYDYGLFGNDVDGQVSCGSEVGVMQWDWYTLEVQAGDCVDIVVDNGAGSADLVALARDADGITAYGLAADHTQLDDEMACANDPWSNWGCPATTVTAETTGAFRIFVAQWYEETGTEPGVDTCALGLSDYILNVAVNGVDVLPTLDQDDQPL